MKTILLSLLLTLNVFAADNSFDRFMPVGSVVTMATQSCPQGYIAVDGKAVSRTLYAKLYLALGTLYGSGDGSTTFNLPDYRAQVLRGQMPLVSLTGTGTIASNNATFVNHNINRTGMKVRLMSGTITGLSTLTDYYAIVADSSNLAFATTRAGALAGTKIAISGTNTGVIQQYEDPDSATRLLQSGVSSYAVGSMQEDSMQGHAHGTRTYSSGGLVAFASQGYINGGTGNNSTYDPGPPTVLTDSTNGTPRVASETRDRNIYVLYCIKY